MSRRILDLALASRLLYSRSPKLLEGIVHATLIDHDAASSEPFHVQLTRGDDPAIAHGECSRCAQTFGACLHVAVLAADLGCSSDLRDALTAGRETRELAAHAPERRHAADVEQRFEGALSVWLAPTLAASSAERLVISASPFAEVDAYVGRAYGETVDLTRTRVLSIFVRRAGERKLLSPREILPARRWSPRDRRVLEYSRDRGANRKAVYALGVEASLTVEAMRLHGGVFVEGTRNLLDFRPVMVRPTVSLTRGALGPGFDTLSALWTPDGGEHPVPFADGVLFTGPFPYVWTRDGAIYAVARDVDLDFATELAASSVLHVPSSRLREAGARLLRATRGRGIALPAHERFGLPPVEIPRIVLRLSGEPLDITGELVALYAAREVALLPSDGVGSEDGRDLATESRGLRHIEDAGLVRTGEGPLAPDTPLRASDDDAVDFWQSKLPSLREATDPPVHVQLSERLARVRVGAPIQARVHVVLEGNWLGTRLEFASRDLPVELEAIRVVLARKQRWVALSDGSIARISSAVKSLADEATTVMDGSAGRLPPHQLGRLERWLRENDGTIDTAVESLRGRLRALAVAAEPDMPVGLTATLRPYQRLGLAWLQFLQALGAGGILGDDMGLGKTITTLAYLLRRKELEGAAPSLVVCPTSVVTNWLRESERFTPSLRVALLQGPARARAATDISGSDVIVTTYALLRRDTDALSAVRWRCAVLDEAQNIKNEASATARAANRLDADLRLALSGTPIENRLTELWSLATFANPGILGTVRAFEKRFERPIAGDRQSPLSEELRAVVRPFLLRRTKDEVLKELPPKTEVDRVVTLKPSDKRMYDALAHSLRISVARDIDNRRGLSGLGVFTALTRLRQMACDPRLVDARLAAGAPSAKREAFLEVVRELVAEGRRALVFSQFVELLTLWRRDLDADGIEYAYLDGSTTKRDQVVADFQAGHAPLFLISLKAGGAGLNLTAADTVILCDPWWNPAVEDQATDRAYRIGQDKPVTVVRLIAQGTIEEKVLSLKAKKRELTRAVIGDDAGALSGLTEADVRVLLGDADAPGLIDEPEDSEHRDGLSRTSPTDTLATDDEVLEPAFDALAVQVQWWLASTGRLEAELASLVDIPVPYASRLARGLPFPCSRAVADRIRARLRAW